MFGGNVMYSASTPRITYSHIFRSSPNPFRDKFAALTDEKWRDVWLSTKNNGNIQGLNFPTVPEQQLQMQLQGAPNWEASINEAFSFYGFVKSQGALKGAKRFLDFGCGWGRVARPFMRDFDLDKMFGFEPNALHAIIARALNPYFTVFTGGFSPDGSIPKEWFDLIVGVSIFSHLSEKSLKEWLIELCSDMRPGGRAVLTTWGMRFFQRLQREQALLEAGQDIHWYSKKCLDGAGDLSKRIEEYADGEFVWFTYTDSKDYGEAFLGEKALRGFVAELGLPMELEVFDTASLSQDVFVLRKSL